MYLNPFRQSFVFGEGSLDLDALVHRACAVANELIAMYPQVSACGVTRAMAFPASEE